MLLSVSTSTTSIIENHHATAQHRHRQDNVPVFASDINIAKDIVSDVPDEISDPVYLRLIH